MELYGETTIIEGTCKNEFGLCYIGPYSNDCYIGPYSNGLCRGEAMSRIRGLVVMRVKSARVGNEEKASF